MSVSFVRISEFLLADNDLPKQMCWRKEFPSSYWLTNFVRISRVPIGVQYTSLNSCAEVKAQGYPAFFLADTFYQNFRSFYWWILSEQLTHSVKISRVPIGGPVQLCWSDDTTISRLPIGRYIFSEFLLVDLNSCAEVQAGRRVVDLTVKGHQQKSLVPLQLS